jgi:plastocyanin
VVENGGGGGNVGAAADVVSGLFAHFEEARVHELIEEADRNAYETFEGELEAYATALSEGGDVDAAANSFADAAQYGAFALVDSVEEVPLDLDLAGGSGGGESGGGGESDLSGGPNVVEGVPDDADHVVEQKAVAYDPAELTVSVGDTVAFPHAAGEAHTVFAYEDGIPEGAEYWASGGFGSESAAREGWANGEGAVQSGQSYVHTFETAGEHEYFCAPHEAAGMVGTIVVE